MYCTDALWQWFNEVDALYQYDGFDTLYGVFGSDYPDEGVFAYAAGDPNGTWTEYVQIKLIRLADDEAAAAVEAALSAESASGEAYADTESIFDSLYEQYNTDPSFDVYSGGRAVYHGDMEDAVYEAALAMEDYEWQIVSLEDGSAAVMRVPIEPDASVYYNEVTDTMFTLRYYAAWQAYSDEINGPDGWLAHASAEWAEGFEDFSLT